MMTDRDKSKKRKSHEVFFSSKHLAALQSIRASIVGSASNTDGDNKEEKNNEEKKMEEKKKEEKKKRKVMKKGMKNTAVDEKKHEVNDIEDKEEEDISTVLESMCDFADEIEESLEESLDTVEEKIMEEKTAEEEKMMDMEEEEKKNIVEVKDGGKEKSRMKKSRKMMRKFIECNRRSTMVPLGGTIYCFKEDDMDNQCDCADGPLSCINVGKMEVERTGSCILHGVKGPATISLLPKDWSEEKLAGEKVMDDKSGNDHNNNNIPSIIFTKSMDEKKRFSASCCGDPIPQSILQTPTFCDLSMLTIYGCQNITLQPSIIYTMDRKNCLWGKKMIRFEMCNGVTIDNCMFRGTYSSAAIYICNSINVSLSRSCFFGCGVVVDVRRKDVPDQVMDITIRDCIFQMYNITDVAGAYKSPMVQIGIGCRVMILDTKAHSLVQNQSCTRFEIDNGIGSICNPCFIYTTNNNNNNNSMNTFLLCERCEVVGNVGMISRNTDYTFVDCTFASDPVLSSAVVDSGRQEIGELMHFMFIESQKGLFDRCVFGRDEQSGCMTVIYIGSSFSSSLSSSSSSASGTVGLSEVTFKDCTFQVSITSPIVCRQSNTIVYFSGKETNIRTSPADSQHNTYNPLLCTTVGGNMVNVVCGKMVVTHIGDRSDANLRLCNDSNMNRASYVCISDNTELQVSVKQHMTTTTTITTTAAAAVAPTTVKKTTLNTQKKKNHAGILNYLVFSHNYRNTFALKSKYIKEYINGIKFSHLVSNSSEILISGTTDILVTHHVTLTNNTSIIGE